VSALPTVGVKPIGFIDCPMGDISARQALLYKSTFSQGVAPHPTKGTRPFGNPTTDKRANVPPMPVFRVRHRHGRSSCLPR
jgi:hypothetical protein